MGFQTNQKSRIADVLGGKLKTIYKYSMQVGPIWGSSLKSGAHARNGNYFPKNGGLSTPEPRPSAQTKGLVFAATGGASTSRSRRHDMGMR